MPKIVKSDEEIRLIYLKNNIRKRMEAKGVTPKQMAIYSHMGESTFMKKKEHPEYFTMPELLRVFKRLDFPDSEILEVMKL